MQPGNDYREDSHPGGWAVVVVAVVIAAIFARANALRTSTPVSSNLNGKGDLRE